MVFILAFIFYGTLGIRKFVMEEWLAVSWRLTSHALYYKIPYLGTLFQFYHKLKFEKTTLDPWMLQSPPHPVIPSNQLISIPFPPLKKSGIQFLFVKTIGVKSFLPEWSRKNHAIVGLSHVRHVSTIVTNIKISSSAFLFKPNIN